jgi:hypothetical protein
MTRNVRLHLDRFGQEALRRFARQRDDSAGSVLRTATLYYLADRQAGRPGWHPPRFIRDLPQPDPVEVDLDDETWDSVKVEAQRQGVEPEVLAQHAVLYFLADMDSGRLADRLSQVIDEEEGAF